MRRELPIIVAAFADERQVYEALIRLEALDIGRDLIGVCARVNRHNGHPQEEVHLLSVLAPGHLRRDVETLLLRCNALSMGGAAEMRSSFGVLPHPGVLEDCGVKLPMGPEYHESMNHGGGV